MRCPYCDHELEFITHRELAEQFKVSDRRALKIAETRSALGLVLSTGLRIFFKQDIEKLRPGKVGNPHNKKAPN